MAIPTITVVTGASRGRGRATARHLAVEAADMRIKVNSGCPGWCRTDLGGPDAPRSVEEGIDTIVWLATQPDGGPSGGFFRDRRRIAW